MSRNAFVTFMFMGGLALVGVGALLGFFIYRSNGSWEQRGQFGDMFGAVNALFSTLSFFGIVVALWLQRKELEIQRDEIDRNRDLLRRSYLQVSLAVERTASGHLTALTTITNCTSDIRTIDNAMILISSETAGLPRTLQMLLGEQRAAAISCTNDIALLQFPTPVYCNIGAIIPLPFFYRENVGVADECIRYRAPIAEEKLQSGVYSARLFVLDNTKLHRTTHDLLVVPSPQLP